ncbi:M24 family metallopeptidase [Achromobacter ruhlandii]|uniref:M24 family metallopeptidase n=1 Tax=Achromobacter ruhlandii TaxID=72557 RepID=UPI002DBCA10E|nr:M24 family metallopeptidase [Achromobacter ruhlandii]MEB6662713.1 M24 family metallopeptidase [Achromobacter ruhlandii]
MPKLTKAVWDYRHDKMNALMDDLAVDAIIFTSADFFQFATNFHTDVLPWERPIFAVVPRNGTPFLVMNELSTHHMRFSQEQGKVWITDISYYAEHPRVTERLPLITQLPELLAARLKAAGLARSRVAVEGGSPVLAQLGRFLPELALRGATAECRALRWQKHAEELAVMAAAASISDWIQDRYRENIRPGRLVQELDFAMASLFVQEAAERFPGEHFEVTRCWTLSGPASASPHGDGASCGARIQEGDVLVNIVIPRLNGLTIENERTWFCGTPSAEQARLWSAAKAANEAAIAAARSGNPVCAIDAAAQAEIEKAGYAGLIRHRTGHAVGIIHHEYPEDMAFNQRPLLDNEVYSAEPGIYAYGIGGFRLDDTVVVGATPRVLTTTPKTLEYATVR